MQKGVLYSTCVFVFSMFDRQKFLDCPLFIKFLVDIFITQTGRNKILKFYELWFDSECGLLILQSPHPKHHLVYSTRTDNFSIISSWCMFNCCEGQCRQLMDPI